MNLALACQGDALLVKATPLAIESAYATRIRRVRGFLSLLLPIGLLVLATGGFARASSRQRRGLTDLREATRQKRTAHCTAQPHKTAE